MTTLAASIVRLLVLILEKANEVAINKRKQKQFEQKQQSRHLAEVDPIIWYDAHFNSLQHKTVLKDSKLLSADKTDSESDEVR